MKLKSWPVKYWQDEEGGWNAEFPGLEGCLTCGDSLEEVKANAVEALSGYLLSTSSRGLYMGAAASDSYDGEQVTPDLPIALALTVLEMRVRARLSQADAAKKIGVAQSTYHRWEDPERCNATVETIERIARAFGRRVEISFPEAS